MEAKELRERYGVHTECEVCRAVIEVAVGVCSLYWIVVDRLITKNRDREVKKRREASEMDHEMVIEKWKLEVKMINVSKSRQKKKLH